MEGIAKVALKKDKKAEKEGGREKETRRKRKGEFPFGVKLM